MKRISFFFFSALLTLVVGCAGSHTKKENGYKVSEESVATTLKFLTSDELKGRDPGTEGIEEAAKYLEEVFVKNSIKPYFITYRDTLSNFSKPAYNIVGYLEGNDPKLKNEVVVIGAHYDHVGIGKAVAGDSIYNGADDNASGTTAVAEFVNYYAKANTNKRSILFCFFSAEEKGLLGSKHLAAKLKQANMNVYLMLNYEMIGVPMPAGKDMVAFMTGYGKSNLAEKINEYSGKKFIGYYDFAIKYQLFRASDNYPFYTEFNIPAHTFSTTDMESFHYYHQPGDEFDEMDTAHMADFIQQMIPITEKLINAETKEIVLKD